MAEQTPALAWFIRVAAALALVESVLIFLGFVTPVLSYSPLNVLFAMAMGVVVAYAGWTAGGLKKAARRGAIVSFAANAILCLASILGILLRTPVLGVSTPDVPSLLIVLGLVLALNALLGAAIAVLAFLLASRLRR